jgi:ribosomal protein S18 acetylase RimI-like enzyme
MTHPLPPPQRPRTGAERIGRKDLFTTFVGVIEIAHGLSADALDEIALLEQRCLAADGGRLKLEWGTLRSRPVDKSNDVLWWDGSRLLGFLGLYCFNGRDVELVGMVDPAARRNGIAASLLSAGLSLCEANSYANVLLVVPRNSAAGIAFAKKHGGELDHSEHALLLTGPPTSGTPSKELPDLEVRVATIADAAEISRVSAGAFGEAPHDIEQLIAEESSQTLVITVDDVTVGTVRLTHDEKTRGIYGFAVDPLFQGRGIGREVLRRVCTQMHNEGASRIGLEVLTQNESALGLYTSIGFKPIATEDYYSIPLNRSDGRS